jgi:hypothetical protein
LYHQRLGHSNMFRIITAQRNGLVTGFTGLMKAIHFCEACALAKSHMKPRKSMKLPVQSSSSDSIPTDVSTRHLYAPFEKILVDISGKIHIRGYQGNYYFILFVDHATRYKWIFFLKSVEAEEIIKTFSKFLHRIKSIGKEVKYLTIVKAFKLDSAGCFMDYNFRAFIFENGSTLEYSSPHTHYQNGIVERAMRTVRESGISMMLFAKVPPYLWTYAFNHAIYLLNLLPTTFLGDSTTPYILMFGTVPNISAIRVFGCDSYALDFDRLKHGPRAQKGIYVGHNPESLSYLFYNPSKTTVISTGHILFQ